MEFSQMLQAVKDFWRPKRRAMKKYILKDGKKHPFAVICPGGGYSMVCSFIEGIPYARELNKRGYSAFVLYYRCKKKAKYPAPMDDLAWAVQEIMQHAEEWKLDIEGYSVWGSSAGGHLAASFGTAELGYSRYGLPKPGALVLAYPVITMGKETHVGSRDNLLGKHPSKEEIAAYSMEHCVNENYPPTFLWYGEADNVVSPENSRMLQEALLKNDIPCELVHYPDVGHGVGLGEKLPCEGWINRAVEFWEKQRNS